MRACVSKGKTETWKIIYQFLLALKEFNLILIRSILLLYFAFSSIKGQKTSAIKISQACDDIKYSWLTNKFHSIFHWKRYKIDANHLISRKFQETQKSDRDGILFGEWPTWRLVSGEREIWYAYGEANKSSYSYVRLLARTASEHNKNHREQRS